MPRLARARGGRANVVVQDFASFADPKASTPTGPAGGSLAGTYPNPTVKQLDGVGGVADITAITTTFGDTTTQRPSTPLVTSDAAVHTLLTIALDADRTSQIDTVVAVHQPATGNTARYNLSIGYVRNGAGAPAATGTVTSSDPRGSNAGAPPAGWVDPIFTISGNNVLIQVQGPAGPITQRWNCVAQIVKA